jgi:WS/DGAT/MGAT family acyltransferase
MIDGVSAVDLLSVLLTPEAQEKPDPPPLWLPRRGPSTLEYAANEALRRLAVPIDLAASLRRVLTNEGGAREDLIERLRAVAPLLGSGLGAATPTPLNQPVGPHRRFDWLPMSLDEIAKVRARFGGTVNDVVLAVVAGAMRRYLKLVRQTDPDVLRFQVMAPVSVRDSSERGRLGNRVAAWLVTLPLAERDPVKRLQAVREETEALKSRHGALGAQTVTEAVEWLGSTPIALGARLMERTTPFNLVVTNVPGPREPLHLLGARMLEAHPMVPLMGTLGLGIALFSYRRTLSWGFTADWDLVPDLHELVLAVQHEFGRLLERASGAS